MTHGQAYAIAKAFQKESQAVRLQSIDRALSLMDHANVWMEVADKLSDGPATAESGKGAQ